jgi:hypothetical protein
MSGEKTNWFSVSSPDALNIFCANCHQDFEWDGFVCEIQPLFCPICKIECVYLVWKKRMVQIIPKNAPEVFTKMLHYFQQNFDELDYVELIGSFEEMADALK